MLRSTTSLGVLSMLFACGATDDSANPGGIKDSAGVTIVENIMPKTLPEYGNALLRLHIGKTGDPRYEFDRIAGVLWSTSGRIVVADKSGMLRLFDSTGVFLRANGQRGDGPGEFRSIERIWPYLADSLGVYDETARRISFWSSDPSFGWSTSLIPPEGAMMVGPVGSFHDGTLLLAGDDPTALAVNTRDGPIRLPMLLFSYGPVTERWHRLGDVVGTELYVMHVNGIPNTMRPMFAHSTVAGVIPGGYFVASNAAYELRFYGIDGHLDRIIRGLNGQRRITPDDRRLARERMLAGAPSSQFGMALRRAVDHMPIPDLVPAFGSHVASNDPPILISSSKSIWVKRYVFPPDATSQPWDVFDASGVFRGRVMLPGSFAPYDIRGDELLGLWRDSSSVEHVRVYAIVSR